MRILASLLLLALVVAGCTSSIPQKTNVVGRAEQVSVPQLPGADCRLLDLPVTGLYCMPRGGRISAHHEGILYSKKSSGTYAGMPVFLAAKSFWLTSTAGGLQHAECDRAVDNWYDNWWYDDGTAWRSARSACQGLTPWA